MMILTVLGRNRRCARRRHARRSFQSKLETITRLSLLWLLAIPTHGSPAKRVTLTFKTADTEYEVSFESSKISERKVRELIVLSPLVTSYMDFPGSRDFWIAGSTAGVVTDKVLFAVPLPYCDENDAAYSGCKKNDIASPDFLHNASVNLQKSKKGLAWLQQLSYPKQLKPVVDYLLRGLAFSVWSEEAEFRYFSTWDARVLKQNYEDLRPAQLCPDVFTALDAADSKETKYQVIESAWSSCVNKIRKTRGDSYPMSAWNAFLHAYGIQERYKEQGPPD